jgi:peroxiredoxin Q/BCP
MSATETGTANAESGLSPRQKALIGFFVLIGLGYAGWLGYRAWFPEPKPERPQDYGDMKTMAERYLRKQKAAPLSGALVEILTKAQSSHVPTKPGYPLQDQAAPDFELIEALGRKVALREWLAKGPVVLIFYYGYHCDHCVSQLFDINEDIKYFHELGAQVIAISADAPELTLGKYQKFGRFNFPVLSDPGNAIAQKYGVYAPKEKDLAEFLWHGTFVISKEGKIVWAYWGDEPFVGNPTLLYEVAKLEGKLP